MPRVHIRGLGAALPEHVVPNETLSKLNGIEPAWIVERTGIQSRFLSHGLEKTSTLAAAAAREALESAALAPAEVDLLVLATSFPDSPLPVSTAGAVKDRLGLDRAVALDIHTPAVGFLLALQLAHRYLRGSGLSNALVVGAECFSATHDLRDRRTCYLFGDGAGALLLSRAGGFATLSEPTIESRGLASGQTSWGDSPTLTSGAFALPLYSQPRERLQSGFEETLSRLLSVAGLEAGKLTFVLPQQLHSVATSAAAAQLGLEAGVLYEGLLDSGNLLSATLPISLHQLAAAGQLGRGQKLALIGTDGRTLWGGAMIAVTESPPRAQSQPSKATARTPAVLRPVTVNAASRATPSQDNFREPGELPEVVLAEARRADVTGSAVSTILFTVGHPGRLARTTVEQMGRETRLIFSRQIRRRDVVIETAPSRYAVILPNQDAADAQRIAERLKVLLERLDPVEEIEIRALYQTLTYRPGERVEAYVGQVLERAGR